VGSVQQDDNDNDELEARQFGFVTVHCKHADASPSCQEYETDFEDEEDLDVTCYFFLSIPWSFVIQKVRYKTPHSYRICPDTEN